MVSLNKYGKNTFYGYVWRYVRRTQAVRDVEMLRPLYPAATAAENIRADLDRFQGELREYHALREKIETYQQFVKFDYDALVLNAEVWLPLLYFLVRIQKPEIVVETGCATGTTASLILCALQHNQRGHLYSIDLRFPSDWLSLNNLASGFLVPEPLQARWMLILKDAKVALPELLASLGRVDLFYHDSDHSYVHQMWEYLTAWPYLPVGGVLASDDIGHNTAFFDFGRQVPEISKITARQRSFGLIVKRHLTQPNL